jgi:genome maintenance exonuclease 1
MVKEKIERVEVKGKRHYQVSNDTGIIGTFPSVTTILSGTSDKSGLDRWRKKVGEAEANRISTLSMNRGTVMHRLVELYKPLAGSKEEKLDQLKELAKTDEEITEFDQEFINEGWIMFYKFYTNSSQYFDRVSKVLESETFLWSSKAGGYAGTVDNISEMTDGKILIIDYKNSRKPKREDWIQDYFLQSAAYYVAFWERTGIKADGVEIWIANEIDYCPQTFSLTAEDVKYYFKEFTNRLDTYKKQLKDAA